VCRTCKRGPRGKRKRGKRAPIFAYTFLEKKEKKRFGRGTSGPREGKQMNPPRKKKKSRFGFAETAHHQKGGKAFVNRKEEKREKKVLSLLKKKEGGGGERKRGKRRQVGNYLSLRGGGGKGVKLTVREKGGVQVYQVKKEKERGWSTSGGWAELLRKEGKGERTLDLLGGKKTERGERGGEKKKDLAGVATERGELALVNCGNVKRGGEGGKKRDRCRLSFLRPYPGEKRGKKGEE